MKCKIVLCCDWNWVTVFWLQIHMGNSFRSTTTGTSLAFMKTAHCHYLNIGRAMASVTAILTEMT